MVLRLLLLFTVIPIVEITLLIRLGAIIGVLDTVLLILFTGIAGTIMVRAAGIQCMFTIRQQLQAGIFPTDELCNALLILIAGVILITPGLITDCVGFALLVPAVRTAIRNRLRVFLEKKIQTSHTIHVQRR